MTIAAVHIDGGSMLADELAVDVDDHHGRRHAVARRTGAELLPPTIRTSKPAVSSARHRANQADRSVALLLGIVISSGPSPTV